MPYIKKEKKKLEKKVEIPEVQDTLNKRSTIVEVGKRVESKPIGE